MDNSAKSPSALAAERLRSIREAAHVDQEAIAREAREWGLRWTRSTVAAIETGRRSIELGELLLLPSVIHSATHARVTLADFFPDSCRVALGAEAEVSGAGFRHFLSGTTDDKTPAELGLRAPWTTAFLETARWVHAYTQDLEEAVASAEALWPSAPRRDLIDAERDAVQEVEQRAARRLGVSPPWLVSLAARKMWGRSLTAERDRRLALVGAGTPGSLRAQAGHITRELMKELETAFAEAGIETRRGSHGDDQAQG